MVWTDGWERRPSAVWAAATIRTGSSRAGRASDHDDPTTAGCGLPPGDAQLDELRVAPDQVGPDRRLYEVPRHAAVSGSLSRPGRFRCVGGIVEEVPVHRVGRG